jgi:basic amino acid/polyamine antiporter, APA family
MASTHRSPSRVPAHLGLWDTVSIIVGIIVGVGIFSTPGKVFRSVDGPWAAIGVWTLGGVLSLVGALCYAELASTYPRSGGEYVYLTRAYGSGAGFLFAWAQLAIIRTGGGIVAVAYVFGDNAALLWPSLDLSPAAYAIVAVVALSFINILGANPGKHTQNLLTVAKVVGLGIVIVGGFCARGEPAGPAVLPVVPSFAAAMVYVLYSYDGWNEATYVCAEVKDLRRNIPRALMVGTLAVTGIYLLYNAAILVSLGFDGARASAAPHADIAGRLLGVNGARAVLVLVMVSALGAVNGTMLTAARLYAAMGADHRLFAPLGWWNHRFQTPAFSLLIQAILCVLMIVGVSTAWRGEDGFEAVVDSTAPIFWLFFLLTAIALFVLRRTDPATERPFRVPLYPLVPLLFCGWCGYMFYDSLRYAGSHALVGVLFLLAGVPLYALSRWLQKAEDANPPTELVSDTESENFPEGVTQPLHHREC